MLRVLTYHRVAEPHDSPWLNPSLISTTPAIFEQQMRHLAKHYRVLWAEEVVRAAAHRQPLPPRSVLLTFDDAYRDFGEIAWPVLQKYRLPATLFVPTGYPDRPEQKFWWDRLYYSLSLTSKTLLVLPPLGALSLRTSENRWASLRSIRQYVKRVPHAQAMKQVDEICRELGDPSRQAPPSVLGWDELRKLSGEGLTLGAHTRTHPLLTRVSPPCALEEICGSQQDLRREIGRVLPIFCYPDGAHNETVVYILRERGFRLAFTTLDGHNDLSSADPLRLFRTNFTRRTSVPIFRLRLLRVVSYLDAWRHRRLRVA